MASVTATVCSADKALSLFPLDVEVDFYTYCSTMSPDLIIMLNFTMHFYSEYGLRILAPVTYIGITLGKDTLCGQYGREEWLQSPVTLSNVHMSCFCRTGAGGVHSFQAVHWVLMQKRGSPTLTLSLPCVLPTGLFVWRSQVGIQCGCPQWCRHGGLPLQEGQQRV